MTYENLFQRAQFNALRRTGIATFLNAPIAEDLEGVEVGIIGIPYDATTTATPGAKHGPREIRTQCVRRVGGPYNVALNVRPFEEHKIFDLGDLNIPPYSIDTAISGITNAIGILLERSILPVSVGGDHFVIFPILKAMFQKHGPVGVIHFDSHCDSMDVHFGEKYNAGTPVRRALEQGFIIPGKFLQVGMRRVMMPDELNFLVEQGSRVISTRELKGMGVEGFKREIKIFEGVKVYITFDIDFVDPAFAPGTGAPEAGGMGSFEALELVRSLRGLDIAGLDLCEVCPPLDVGNITALLAAQILYEMVCILP